VAGKKYDDSPFTLLALSMFMVDFSLRGRCNGKFTNELHRPMMRETLADAQVTIRRLRRA
jgi:hypothetical protein